MVRYGVPNSDLVSSQFILSFCLQDQAMTDVPHPNSAISPRLERLVVVSRNCVQGWRKTHGLSDTTFLKTSGLSKATYYRMKRQEPVEESTAKAVADAMGLSDVKAILMDGETEPPELPADLLPLAIDEWDIAVPMDDWVHASNGLRYRIFQMRNRFSPMQVARGKCYDLDGVFDQERERITTCCTRHSEVCRRVGSHSNLPVSYRSSPDRTRRLWWIIDSWPAGPMLAEQLHAGRWTLDALRPLMTQLASGLQALHAADVVRRELAPRNIFFDTTSRHVVLTDFELGKLLEGGITVSKDSWPVDPYRAPEVGKGCASKAADYFSWGRIFVHAATGALPQNGSEDAALKSVILPRGLREFVSACVDVMPMNRPRAFDSVLKVLANWV